MSRSADRPVERRRSTARLVVSVGTDHHRFDRLIEWVDEWRDHHPTVVTVVQAGTSSPSRHGDSRDLIPHRELVEIFSRAVAVVSHGGPSTVMDARMAGRLPIVVPRSPDLDEHVDGHQLRFAQHLDHHGIAVVVHDKQALFDAIDRAFAAPDSFAVAGDTTVAGGVTRFGRIVDRLLDTKTPVTDVKSAVAVPPAQPRFERRRSTDQAPVAPVAGTEETKP
jgi:UDP-N-acetylglucosamine transferase subunit ALG13